MNLYRLSVVETFMHKEDNHEMAKPLLKDESLRRY